MVPTLSALANMNGVDLIRHLEIDHAELTTALATMVGMIELMERCNLHEQYHQEPPYELDHNHANTLEES